MEKDDKELDLFVTHFISEHYPRQNGIEELELETAIDEFLNDGIAISGRQETLFRKRFPGVNYPTEVELLTVQYSILEKSIKNFIQKN